uniref:Uncharacterized protein n=1 Tax=Amphimedon queenslandica TaxID=400682 RepID=A0A1X7U831_AMPQE
MSKLRRKKTLKSVNPDIADLAQEDISLSVGQNLFGSGFEVKMKERAESVKLLAASRPSALSQGKKFSSERPSHCSPKRQWPVLFRETLAEEGIKAFS